MQVYSTLSCSDTGRSGSSTLSPRAGLRSPALGRTLTRTRNRYHKLSETPDLFAVSELLAEIDTATASPAPCPASKPQAALIFATKARSAATQTRSNLASAPHTALTAPDPAPDPAPEALDLGYKRPAFNLPKTTEYARSRMGAILILIARGGGHVDFKSWDDLAELLGQAGLIPKAHPANLRHWIDTLQQCKIIRQGSPGWIVYPPEEDLPKRKLPRSRRANGLRLSALWSLEELIAAGFSELETLLEGSQA